MVKVIGTTLGYVYGLKLGCNELSEQGLSGISFDVLNLLGGGIIRGSLLTDYLCMSSA